MLNNNFTQADYEDAYKLILNNVIKIEKYILLLAANPETTDSNLREATSIYQNSLKRLKQAEEYKNRIC